MSLYRIDVDWPGSGCSMVMECADQEAADAVARHKAKRQQAKLNERTGKGLVTWEATPLPIPPGPPLCDSFAPSPPSKHPQIVAGEVDARAIVREAKPERHTWGAL